MGLTSELAVSRALAILYEYSWEVKEIKREPNLLRQLRISLAALESALERLLYLLKDADEHARNGDEKLGDWVLEIAEIAFEVEDLVSELFAKMPSRKYLFKMEKENSCFSSSFFWVGESTELRMLRMKFEQLSTKISDLTDNLVTYGIRELSEGGRFSNEGQSYLVPFDCGDVVGLDEDINKFVVHLTKENNPHRIFAIYGIEGAGKTTMAAKVYKDRNVRRCFDCFSWVSHASQQVVAVKDQVWKTILKELDYATAGRREKIAKMSSDEVVQELHRVIVERKCLLVLDDVLNDETWNYLRLMLATEKTDSIILLTTCQKDVALQTERDGYLHHLCGLDDCNSWKLLKKKALFGRDVTNLEEKEKMEGLGREMLKNCGGLPLAIVVLGGLLSTRHTIDEWELVHKNVKMYLKNYQINEQGGSGQLGITWVLRLIYDELPCHLKPCILHLSHFPIGREIRVSEACRMWIAEGFISQNWQRRGLLAERSIEDAAYECFHELAKRCMVQVGKRNSIGRVKTCRVHDLVRNLCLLKAEDENFLQAMDCRNKDRLKEMLPSSEMINGLTLSRVRRLVISMDYDGNLWRTLSNSNAYAHLRSLIFFNLVLWIPNGQVLKSLFNNFQILRVLKFENLGRFGSLPKEIGRLTNLRFLSLKDSCVEKLPSSIGNLKSLQTLDLRTNFILKLPNVTRKLVNLRHLYLPSGSIVRGEKLQLDNLPNLQTLVNIPSQYCDVNDIVKLSNLRKLKICVDKNFESKPKCINTLNHLHSLVVENSSGQAIDIETIILRCPRTQKLDVKFPIQKLPEYNQFAPNLMKLTLTQTFLRDDPMVTLQRLPNLRILFLNHNAFVGFDMVSLRGGFPLLESLFLGELFYLEEWWVEKGSMSNLSSLHIENCCKLETLPDGLRYITTLKEIVIQRMPIKFKTKIVEGGEDFYVVQHVNSLVILNSHS